MLEHAIEFLFAVSPLLPSIFENPVKRRLFVGLKPNLLLKQQKDVYSNFTYISLVTGFTCGSLVVLASYLEFMILSPPLRPLIKYTAWSAFAFFAIFVAAFGFRLLWSLDIVRFRNALNRYDLLIIKYSSLIIFAAKSLFIFLSAPAPSHDGT